MVTERKFRPKIKIKDDRKVKDIRPAIPGVRAYSSKLSRAVAKQKAHPDYKPPNHGKRKK